MEPIETVSRTDEIRALFIFGLLAVLASIRVSSSTITEITFPYGKVNITPVIDEIIVLWSLYALFMIIGLSGDVVGKSLASSIRAVSNIFLQLSYIYLAIFLIPIGLVAFGIRFILLLLLFTIALAIGFLLYLYKKDFGWKKIREYFRRDKNKSINGNCRQATNLKKIHFLFWATVFSISTYVLFSTSENAFAGSAVLFICFILSACSISMILFLSRKRFVENLNEEYSADY